MDFNRLKKYSHFWMITQIDNVRPGGATLDDVSTWMNSVRSKFRGGCRVFPFFIATYDVRQKYTTSTPCLIGFGGI